jgi:hypothetical protein
MINSNKKAEQGGSATQRVICSLDTSILPQPVVENSFVLSAKPHPIPTKPIVRNGSDGTATLFRNRKTNFCQIL